MLREHLVPSGVVLLCVLLGIFVLQSHGKNDSDEIRDFDCESLTGIAKDECLSSIAHQIADDALCSEIQDSLVKDICYRDFIFDAGFIPLEPFHDIGCSVLSNPVFEYECETIGARALMWGVVVDRSLPEAVHSADASGGCGSYDNYHADFCLSSLAAGLATDDLERAGRICSQIHDEFRVGECMFLVASALAKELLANPGRPAEAVMDVCDAIAGIPWQPFCYYVLAENLALIRPQAPLELLARASTRHPGLVEDSTIYELVRLLPHSQREEFCSVLEGAPWRACSWGIGLAITKEEGYNTSWGIEQCKDLTPEYHEDCILAVGAELGYYVVEGNFGPLSPEAFIRNVALCGGLPERDEFLEYGEYMEKLRFYCFRRLGITLVQYFLQEGWDESVAERICWEFPPDVRHFCVFGIGLSAAGSFIHDVPAAVEICERLPDELLVSHDPDVKDYCFGGLGRGILFTSLSDIPGGADKCENFPRDFRQQCLDILGMGSADPRWNIAGWAARCEEFPLSYRESCYATIMAWVRDNSQDSSEHSARCAQLPQHYHAECMASLSGSSE